MVILTDCTSSQTEEIQRVNLADMERMGAVLMDTAAFEGYHEHTVPDLAAGILADMERE